MMAIYSVAPAVPAEHLDHRVQQAAAEIYKQAPVAVAQAQQ
jgi:hypothetical protein